MICSFWWISVNHKGYFTRNTFNVVLNVIRYIQIKFWSLFCGGNSSFFFNLHRRLIIKLIEEYEFKLLLSFLAIALEFEITLKFEIEVWEFCLVAFNLYCLYNITTNRKKCMVFHSGDEKLVLLWYYRIRTQSWLSSE